VLGLAYKPGTGVVEESQALALVRLVAGMGGRVVAYDALARFAAAIEVAGSGVKMAGSIGECLAGAQVVVVATPDPAFGLLRPADLARCAPGVAVVDCWRTLAPQVASLPSVRYLALGCAPDPLPGAALLADLWAVSPAELVESVA
jgi:UDPglucose 6-dehydrogenase